MSAAVDVAGIAEHANIRTVRSRQYIFFQSHPIVMARVCNVRVCNAP